MDIDNYIPYRINEFKNFSLDMKLFLSKPFRPHSLKFNNPSSDKFQQQLKIN